MANNNRTPNIRMIRTISYFQRKYVLFYLHPPPRQNKKRRRWMRNMRRYLRTLNTDTASRISNTDYNKNSPLTTTAHSIHIIIIIIIIAIEGKSQRWHLLIEWQTKFRLIIKFIVDMNLLCCEFWFRIPNVVISI